MCLHCYQHGHIRKQCRNLPPTMADVVGGRAGAAISYAQVLAGTKAAHPVMLPSKPSLQPPLDANALTRRAASQDSACQLSLASQKNGAVSSGQPSGETVSNSLISPVAATLQAPEVPAAEQAPVKQTLPSSVDLVQQINDGKLGVKAVEVEIGNLERDRDRNKQEDREDEKEKDKKKLEELEKKMAKWEKKEARDNESRERKRKTREESSSERERGRSASEKRKREEEAKSREREEDELRKSREDYPPHKGHHGKSNNDRTPSRNNGYHN